MLTPDLTSLVPLQFSYELQNEEVAPDLSHQTKKNRYH